MLMSNINNKQNTNFDPYYLNLAIKLGKGSIKTEKYEEERKIATRTKLKEIKELAVIEPYIYQNYLYNLPYRYRMKAIKEVHDLSNEIIRHMGSRKDKKHFSGNVNKFLSGDYDVTNGYSFYLYALAIILDAPVEYFFYDDINSNKINLNNFSEYLIAATDVLSFQEIINNTIERPIFRKITGYTVINKASIYEVIDFVRLDKRVEFFSFEIFIQKRNLITGDLVETILKIFRGNIKYTFLSNPLLRDAYKLSFFGIYEKGSEHFDELKKYTAHFRRCRLNEEIHT